MGARPVKNELFWRRTCIVSHARRYPAIKISILGTEYTISKGNAFEDALLETNQGYCDNTRKKIVINELRPELGSKIDIEPVQKRVLRHEIIHAFLFESGLDENSDWGTDETLVDWIALQFPKLEEAFKKVNCL